MGENDTEVVLTTDAGERRLRRRAGTWPGLLARRVDHGIGVVEIQRMSRSGPNELDARLAAIEAPGPLSGLVIDLCGKFLIDQVVLIGPRSREAKIKNLGAGKDRL